MITIIAGTNRPKSYTLKLATYYQHKLLKKGVSADILSLTDLPASLMHSDMYGKQSPDFLPLQEIITNTTKYIFVIPEYNGSFPGILKMFIDACKFPESFYGKKAALVGLSTGKYGNIRGLEHFTGICNYINLHVLPLKIHITSIHKEFDDTENLFKEDTIKFTNQQIDWFLEF